MVDITIAIFLVTAVAGFLTGFVGVLWEIL